MRAAIRFLRGGAITISSVLATMTMPGAVVACVLIAAVLGITLLVLLSNKANENLVRIMQARRPKAGARKIKRGE